MNPKLEQEAKHTLQNQYDNDQIELQPELANTSARPDLGVRSEDGTDYFLLVECSSMNTRHRRKGDIASLKRMMEASNIRYGALISEKIEYIFELDDSDGETVERELPGYPNSDQDGFDSVLSQEELHFRLWRTLDSIRELGVSPNEYHNHVFHALFRKFVAEQERITFDIESIDEDWLIEIDNEIQNRYPAYSIQAAPLDISIQREILRSFENVNISNIQPRAARAFIDLIEQSSRASESITPLRVADAIVDLAGVEPRDEVLDPAAGIGNVIRETAHRGANASAVEVNLATTNHALFLNAVQDISIDYTVVDFLSQALDENKFQSLDLDHIVVDPPFGYQYERPDGNIEKNAEEQFILKAIEFLKDGGTITAVIPQSSLYKESSKEFRNIVTNDYTLATIVEVNKPVFKHTAVPTAIVQIKRTPVGNNEEIEYQIIEDSDSEDEFDKAIQTIEQGNAPTIQYSELVQGSFLPSEIVGVQRTTKEVKEQYGQVVDISAIAEEIRTGVSNVETTQKSNSTNLPYLRPKDVSEADVAEFAKNTGEAVLAGPEDVLISVKGDTSVVHVPGDEVVPASNWAIIRFQSTDEAQVYSTFLESELGQQQLEVLRTGATIPYIPLRRLEGVLVPQFSDDEIAKKAKKINQLRQKASEFERQRAEIEDDLEELV